MKSALEGLPRLGADQMMPCCKCQRDLSTGIPLFFRYEVTQCGIDGGAEKPIVVMAKLPVQNICHECGMADSEVLQLLSQGYQDQDA